MSSSRSLTGCCEKNSLSRGKLGEKGWKFALASGEEANNREKARLLSAGLLVYVESNSVNNSYLWRGP